MVAEIEPPKTQKKIPQNAWNAAKMARENNLQKTKRFLKML
jgi:hypothetical protein